ncbi:SPOR domain-containing protein [Abyssibius alkaniclasticus]|uniref:SPOR domain-containing protein n=1 Tax=Abyssibius alkaniclasticus TaxID=2881234 RepID=UPI002364182F|nr:SPOR domain-containing protein [Abyssibius alkaniclasticus]UPH70041.1 SPOR domain-containing protein [Abyssibius alkaniclasticus]
MQDVDSESRSRRNAPADDGEPTGFAARAVLWFGAVLSIVLVAGVVYWAYSLGQRDASEVPVIRALAGLPRERPAEAGGTQVPNQGLAVNEVLGGTESADPTQMAALAPEASGLAADDQPVLPDLELQDSISPEAESGEVVPEPPGSFAPPLPAAPGTAAEAAPEPPESTEEIDEGVSVTLDIPRPLRRAPRASTSAEDSVLSAAIAEALAQANGAAATPPPTSVEPTAPASAPGDLREVPIGTRMIQLGAFDSEAGAAAQWDGLAAAHPQLFATMERYIERRQAGGRVFYRLRALGFDDLEQARAMCAALLARDVQCITVTARE